MQQARSPSTIRRILRRVAPLRRAYGMIQVLFPLVRLVEGRLRGSDLSLRCLFVGDGHFRNNLLARMYAGAPTVLGTWRTLGPLLRMTVRRRRGEFDLCIVTLPQGYDSLLGRHCDFKGREFVRQVVDTAGDWEAVRRKFSSRRRAEAKTVLARHGLSLRASNEPADLEYFYQRMYVPYVRSRHGALAVVTPIEKIRTWFKDGFLQLVTREGLAVAGVLSEVDGDRLVALRLGILDADPALVRCGALTAIYLFQLQFAVNRGLREVDLRYSNPFLDDGVFRHKALWGARAVSDHESGTNRVFYFVAGPSSKLAHFFAQNPLIVEIEGRLGVVVGDPSTGATAPLSEAEVRRRYHTAGIDDIVIATPERFADGRSEQQNMGAASRTQNDASPDRSVRNVRQTSRRPRVSSAASMFKLSETAVGISDGSEAGGT